MANSFKIIPQSYVLIDETHAALTIIDRLCCEKTDSCGEQQLQRCSKPEIFNVCKIVRMHNLTDFRDTSIIIRNL